MTHYTPQYTRRHFLAQIMLGAVAAPALRLFTEENLRFLESGHFADELIRTPAQTEGPFYPNVMPLDTDNDLLIIGTGQQAAGEVTHLTGRIMDLKGDPIRNAVIEIWQVDHSGAYIHTGSGNAQRRDKLFQGFGRFETASDGRYRFRTIKPVAYPGRTPHIHVKVKKGSSELLTTQCYVKGEPQNARDGVLNGIRDARQRESVVVDFVPIKESRIGELAAEFNIVIGHTPVDPDH